MNPVLHVMIVCVLPAVTVAGDITLESLLGEMVDLNRLAELPDPAYVTKQASSYDRASVKPGSDSWFANGDAGHFIRIENRDGREEFVLLDAEGPGAVVRMWSAKPSGIIRIYIDKAEMPALEVPMEDLLSGKVEGMGEPFAGIRARGYNLYFPIPYAKHCKITTDIGGYHYHVNYRTYAKGTMVESFRSSLLEQSHRRIQRVVRELSPDAAHRFAEKWARFKDGWSTTTFEQDGGASSYRSEPVTAGEPGVITCLAFEFEAEHLAEVLRTHLLEITFDGETTVSCPIGDFFGIAGQPVDYVSHAMGAEMIAPDCVHMWSRWPMPYRNDVMIEVTPLQGPGRKPVRMKKAVHWQKRAWTHRSMHFHAGWRMEKDIPSRPFSDWTHIECKGNGRFVGSMLHVINYHRAWWGEGDEKIYVDGEAFPSHFGTGSEDYYGYAWCDETPFQHTYHNQLIVDGPGVYGNTVLNRLHILDDIPFAKSFKFDMENWHWIDDTKTTRAATNYWYARPGGTDSFKPLTKDNVEYVKVPEYKPFFVKGALEGEALTVVEKTAGDVRHMERNEAFSHEHELWWLGGKPGDTLTLGFDVPEAGRYDLVAQFSKGHDYGIINVFVNGKQVVKNRDMFDPVWFALVPKENLGDFELAKSGNTLTVEIVGKHKDAQSHYAFGLDYLIIRETHEAR